MDKSVVEWFRLGVGVIVFVFCFGLLIWDIAVGVKQRLVISKIESKQFFKLTLSPDYVGFLRMCFPVGLLLVISLITWQSDKVAAGALMAISVGLAILWLVTRPSVVLVGLLGYCVTLVDVKKYILKSIIEGNRTTHPGTIELECEDGKEVVKIECELTDENKKVIAWLRDKVNDRLR